MSDTYFTSETLVISDTFLISDALRVSDAASSRYTVCPIHAVYSTIFMSERHRDSSKNQNMAVNNRDAHGDSSEYDSEV
jgi:hypothetical protein